MAKRANQNILLQTTTVWASEAPIGVVILTNVSHYLQ